MTKQLFISALVVLTTLGMTEAKRSAPQDVRPVTKDGITYSAPHDQMGCVVAKGEKNDRPLWFRQVYVVKYDADLEKDVQDCFITDLTITDRKLIVTNDAGGQFAVDLENLSVTVLQGKAVIERVPRHK